MNDCTVVVALDRRTIEFAALTVPTWPDVAKSMPCVVMYDAEQLTPRDVHQVLPEAQAIPWCGTYETQREKMLTAHVYAAWNVKTPWMLKIDCDAFHDGRDVMWPPAWWFENDVVLIGNSWGYWRAKGGSGTLEEWAEKLEQFGDRHFHTERARWAESICDHDHPKGPRLRERRLASWICFQRTEWVADVARLFASDYGENRLPVPSHDTSLWAVAVRSNARVILTQAKRYGWDNRTTLKGCREAVG